MSSRLLLFTAAAVGTIAALHLILKPHVFRYVMIGLTSGCTAVFCLSYINKHRNHSIEAHYNTIKISLPPANFTVMQPIIYEHLSEDYENRGELELGEEEITIEPYVFSQIGVIDIDGVRKMWTNNVLPHFKTCMMNKLPFDDSVFPTEELEKEIVFCDLGSGVGNVCLQILAETKCQKCVGVEVIPSRVRAAELATKRAKEVFPETFEGKQAKWLNCNIVECAEQLREENVNVVFTHSWMFDDELMQKMSATLLAVPMLECIITSRKLTAKLLKESNFVLKSVTSYSADWNKDAPFYVYCKEKSQ